MNNLTCQQKKSNQNYNLTIKICALTGGQIGDILQAKT
ncbi:hypothetical protein SAMN05216297_109187 [Flavobacterium phragmitis]|uniref:Uncharacterized protein n=1 Tax=Flavobacterium phragmitis TaxID=739143 RepID=A0A1I1TIU2_9FLAO|nr:hypothetical protein SAMN05216297_109187 [Flavobacterium phragmitis]